MKSVRTTAGLYKVNDRYRISRVGEYWMITDTHKKVRVGRREIFYRKREALAFLKEYLEIGQILESLQFLLEKDHSRIPEARTLNNKWVREERRIRAEKTRAELENEKALAG